MTKHLIKYNKYFPIAVLVVLILIPVISQDPYYLYVLTGMFIWGTMAIGLLISLRTGIYNFAPSAFMAIGAYTTALMVTKLGISFWATLPVAGILAIIVAIVIGLPILRVQGIYFILITALLSQVVILLLSTFPEVTGGWGGVKNIPPPDSILGLTFTTNVSYYYLILVFMVIIVVFAYRFLGSYIGKIYRNIGTNESLAHSVGVELTKYKVQSFAVSACVFSLCGCFYVPFTNYVEPRMFDFMVSVDVWFNLVLGGAGSVFGPLIGTVVVRLIQEQLTSVAQISPIILGAIVVIVILFLPKGLISLPQRINDVRSRLKS